MRVVSLLVAVLASLASSSAFAASYQRTDGTIVDPITYGSCIGCLYSGPDLHAGVSIPDANLRHADLRFGDLRNAVLAGGDFWATDFEDADLSDADLRNSSLYRTHFRDANLAGADLRGATSTFRAIFSGTNLQGTDFRGVDLGGAMWLGQSSGSAIYDANTSFIDAFAGNEDQYSEHYDGIFDPVAAGWTLVPEPSTTLLFGLGLAGLASRRR